MQTLETRLNGFQISKIQKGYLKFTGKLNYPSARNIETQFPQSFNAIPEVVFALANIHIVGNRAPLWSISNLEIDQTKFTCIVWSFSNFVELSNLIN